MALLNSKSLIMKKELQLTLLALILVPFLAIAAGHHRLDGIYTDRTGDYNIQLITDQYGILLKEGRYGEWRRFDQHARHQFVGPRGQRLIILDHGTIKLKKRYHSVTLKKRRADLTYDRWWDDYNRYGQNHHRSHEESSHLHGSPNRKYAFDISGSWFDQNGRRIVLDHYDNGLSVRNGQSWERTFYHKTQDWGSMVIYRNTYGDTITRDRDGHLTWRGRYGPKIRRFHRECR